MRNEPEASIRSILLPALQQKFPDRGMRVGELPHHIAIFPAMHPEVGDVIIWDDGREAIVDVRNITHGHFACYDPGVSDEEALRQVTEAVIDFLDALFADQMLLFRVPGGGGGWRSPGYEAVLGELLPEAEVFVWSGPVSPTTGP